ncbi:hypothetical protein OAV81_05215 [Candidatus Thioglobus sp.]|nr:hypothetical protein [Candidatus Thioglobus sp.]
MKKFLKIVLVIIIILAVVISILQFVGNREIEALVDQGILSSDFTKYELAMLCDKMDGTIFWGCISGGVW